jgi:hypothetical protein
MFLYVAAPGFATPFCGDVFSQESMKHYFVRRVFTHSLQGIEAPCRESLREPIIKAVGYPIRGFDDEFSRDFVSAGAAPLFPIR